MLWLALNFQVVRVRAKLLDCRAKKISFIKAVTRRESGFVFWKETDLMFCYVEF